MSDCVRSAGIALAIVVLLGVAFPAPCAAEYVTIQGDQFMYQGEVVKLKGTNYYPRDHMWADLWNSWDWNEIVYEVGLVRDLGLNCVRILVPYSHGGWGGANPPASRLDMLEDLVNVFGDNGIRSCVTLFDWETSFPVAGTARERDHLSYVSAIVNRLKNNENVFMWDVKNEPDHPANTGGYDNWDSNPAKRDQIVSWLHRMCDAVRAIDPNHPASAGLRWWENLNEVVGFVDVAIFHSYWSHLATQQIVDARTYMGADQKPILCEEFGWPTNPCPCNRDGREIWDYNETQQLSLYTIHLTAFTQQNIAGCIQWMTFDAKGYTSDPNQSFEQYFGLWRYDYSLKPAGAYYRDHFPVVQFAGDGGPPDPVTQFLANAGEGSVQLSWVNPSNDDFAGTIIRSSTTGYPAAVDQGTLVCNRAAAPGSSDSFLHTGTQHGVTYYYSAFAYDDGNRYASPAQALAVPDGTSLSTVKHLPDNTQVGFVGVVVTAVFQEDGCIYVEEPDRTCGIRVVASNTGLSVGDRVDVAGKVYYREVSGVRSERQIVNAAVGKSGSGAPTEPLAMNCKSVGGGADGPLIPGVDGGVGPNNIGLLVRIAGTVCYRVGNYLWVDDGSNVPDYMGKTGVMVRCSFDPGVSVGDIVICTGVVEGSVPIGWTTNRRCVHARAIEDIVLESGS